MVIVPAGQGAATISVSVSKQVSNFIRTFAYEKPEITSVLPLSGPRTDGTSLITVVGKNFGTNFTVWINNIGFSSFAAFSNSVIVLLCPPGFMLILLYKFNLGEGSNKLYVVGGDQASIRSNQIAFNYGPPIVNSTIPTILRLSSVSKILTILGNNFGFDPVVTIGGIGCNIASRSHISLTCSIQVYEGLNLPLKIAVSGVSSINYFISFTAPNISRIIPALASVSQILTVYGSEFGPNCLVTVGSLNCPIIYRSPQYDQLECILPVGSSANLTVAVISVGGAAAYFNSSFSYSSPVISSITLVSSIITIVGTNFGNRPSVLFGSVRVNNAIVSQNGFILSFTLPAGQQVTSVTVQAGNQISNLVLFRYPAPIISLVNPSSGSPSGWNATITGIRFPCK